MAQYDIDYRAAFEDAPIGQIIQRNRRIVACNHAFAKIFGGTIEDFVGTSSERLYPTQTDFAGTGERIGRLLDENLTILDDRVMRRLNGELFWVRVRGYTYTPRNPHEHTLWIFSDLTHVRQQASSLTPRERDVAALLIDGLTGKEVARALDISPRTVDIYKTRLLRKYDVASTPELVQRLLAR
ncbi:MAG: PAS and helix-turn-helix domain-containing protein [Rhizobiaceae bacterium]|nr:PAS and helix-turn-helix domain-containing protein [Rhizobiaceae bacterium]MCO5069601.1 PAS and helix-turn-helix domain-containing protein [Rhizobiaceae bacterium]